MYQFFASESNERPQWEKMGKFLSLKTLDTFKRQKMGLFLHYLSAKYFHFGNHTEKQYAKQIFAQID